MNIYVRKVASEGINHHVEHCIFVPASRVLFSSRCFTFRVSLLSSFKHQVAWPEHLTEQRSVTTVRPLLHTEPSPWFSVRRTLRQFGAAPDAPERIRCDKRDVGAPCVGRIGASVVEE